MTKAEQFMELTGGTEASKHSIEGSHSLALAREQLGKTVLVTVDRPLGSLHPRNGFKYLVNYGYLSGIKAPDSEDLDAYILGMHEAVDSFEGVCIAIVHRNDDDDDKLVVVPDSALSMSDAEILQAVHFQEQWFDSIIVRK